MSQEKSMTPEQSIKHAILIKAAEFGKFELPEIAPENIDEVWDEIEGKNDSLPEAANEVRCSGEETGLPQQWSRHYESEAVAAKMPNGKWVGWTYWHGGGKHGEPEAIDWMGDAYFVDVTEEEKVVTVRTFSKASQ